VGSKTVSVEPAILGENFPLRAWLGELEKFEKIGFDISLRWHLLSFYDRVCGIA
jgi:hypothetical protein